MISSYGAQEKETNESKSPRGRWHTGL